MTVFPRHFENFIEKPFNTHVCYCYHNIIAIPNLFKYVSLMITENWLNSGKEWPYSRADRSKINNISQNKWCEPLFTTWNLCLFFFRCVVRGLENSKQNLKCPFTVIVFKSQHLYPCADFNDMITCCHL